MNEKWTRRQKAVCIGCLIAYIGAYIGRLNLSAALPEMSAAMNLSGGQSGMLQTVFALTYAAGQLVNGAIVDRVSARLYILLGLLGSAVANLMLGLSGSYGVLLAAALLNGATQSMLWTPIVKLVAGEFSGKARSNVSFLLSLSLVVGHLAAWALAGSMAKLVSWRFSFLIPAATLVVIGLVSTLMLKPKAQEKSSETAQTRAGSSRPPLLQLLFGSGLWLLLLACVCNGFVRDGVMTWGPSILDSIGMTALSSVALSLIIPVFNLIGILISHSVHRRAAGSTRTTIGLMMLVGAAASLALWLFGLRSLVVCTLLLGTLCALMYGLNPLLTALLPMEYDKAKCVGLVAGLVDSLIYVGSSLAGVVTGAVQDRVGWSWVFVLWTAVALAGAALSLIAAAQKKKAGN